PTVSALADLVRQPAPNGGLKALVPVQPAGSALPFFAVHGGAGPPPFFSGPGARPPPGQPLFPLPGLRFLRQARTPPHGARAGRPVREGDPDRATPRSVRHRGLLLRWSRRLRNGSPPRRGRRASDSGGDVQRPVAHVQPTLQPDIRPHGSPHRRGRPAGG